jgi:proteasome lid subunit RPN8/RPN11
MAEAKKYVMPRTALRELHRLARQAQRLDQGEVCGLLGANVHCRLVLYLLPNRSRRPGHFRIRQADYLAAQRAISEQGKRVLGTFHSHPISEAIPSPGDLQGQRPGSLLLIYDVCGRKARLWKILKRGRQKITKEIPCEVGSLDRVKR